MKQRVMMLVETAGTVPSLLRHRGGKGPHGPMRAGAQVRAGDHVRYAAVWAMTEVAEYVRSGGFFGRVSSGGCLQAARKSRR
ncbi:hypothetical protein D7231_16410 [Streptomyces klenkii]|uniref:Uncharacterized protein n=1 Tax=Streptomyces klenkii TaxID=1420899 RepID=A0A3B0BGU8_9ACTN|nr:hypothetical protein D7231_16410 [Streptomyces klenkii]